MKASEMITKLQSLVAKHGDQEVRIDASMDVSPNTEIMNIVLSTGEIPPNHDDVFFNIHWVDPSNLHGPLR